MLAITAIPSHCAWPSAAVIELLVWSPGDVPPAPGLWAPPGWGCVSYLCRVPSTSYGLDSRVSSCYLPRALGFCVKKMAC